MKFRSPLFLRYLISYFAMLIFPIVILVLFIMISFMSAFDHEVDSNLDSSLISVKNHLDLQLTQLENIVYEVANSSNVSMANENPYYYFYSAIQMLRNYNNTHEFIDEIAFYPAGGDLICLSTTTTSLDRFLNNMYIYNNWNTKDSFRDLNTPSRILWRASEDVLYYGGGKRRIITGIFPSDFNNTLLDISHKFSVIYMVNEQYIQKLAESANLPPDSSLMILDPSGQALFSSSKDEHNLLSYIRPIEPSAGVVKKEIKVNKTKYLIRYITSSSRQNQWTYAVLVNEDLAFAKPIYLFRLFLVTVTALIGIGILAVYLFSRWNYKPMLRLRDTMYQTTGKIPDGRNEIDAASHIISDLAASRVKVFEKTKDSMVHSLLQRLVKGSFAEISDFNEEGQPYGLSLKNNCFRIFFIDHDTSLDREAALTVRNLVVNTFSETFSVFYLDNPDNNVMTFILSSDDTYDEQARQYFFKIKPELDAICSSRYAIYTGRAYNGIKNINTSYQEASNLLKYRLTKVDGNILFYEDFSFHSEYVTYPKEELELLQKELISCNVERIDLILKDITNLVQTINGSRTMLMCLCYDIFNTINKNLPYSNTNIATRLKDYLKSLIDKPNKSSNDFAEFILELNQLVCNHISGTDYHRSSSSLVNRVIHYLQSNYTSPDFSVQSLADVLGMSPTNLSQQFKNHTGNNITEYIVQYRMEKSKDLLRTTNMSVREIAEMVGYLSTPSFIGKFKKVFGKTPGEYRNLFGTDINSNDSNK